MDSVSPALFERTPVNATHTNLARAFLKVSEIEGQRRRMQAAGRALKKELDEQCTGTGVCEPSWEFTPTVGSERVENE
jgi:hypothetical protein